MRRTPPILLTSGALDLAGKLIERRHVLVGPGAVKTSLEVHTLVRLGVADINGSHLILRRGGRRALERALKLQSVKAD